MGIDEIFIGIEDNMRVLFITHNDFREKSIVHDLKEYGCDIKETEGYSDLAKQIKEITYHFVFSVKFEPEVANICFQGGTKYVCWQMELPCLDLYSVYLTCPTTYVFLYDYSICEKLRSKGIKNVYYLPWAVISAGSSEGKEESPSFVNDVSLVTSFHTDEYEVVQNMLEHADEFTKGYLQAIIKSADSLKGEESFTRILENLAEGHLENLYPVAVKDDNWQTKSWIYANCYLARFLSAKERMKYIRNIQHLHHIQILAVDAIPSELEGMEIKKINNEYEADLLYQSSKINLNITERSVQTGIPLNAMQIMGNRGFLLTDYQEGFLEFFVPGEDFVFYIDEQDMLDKIDYYLKHDEERMKIANSGYEKVRNCHTLNSRIKEMLQVVFDDEELEIYAAIHELEKYRKENGNVNDGIPKENKKVDDFFELVEGEKEIDFCLKHLMTKRINRLLAQKTIAAWDEMTVWSRRNYTRELNARFWEYHVMRVVLNVYIDERKRYYNTGETISVLNFSSFEEIMKTYYNTIFLLRRVEYDIEPKYEIVNWVREKCLSDIFIYHVIENGQINNKARVMETFTKNNG